MAITKQGRLSVSLLMSNSNPKSRTNKVSNITFRVTSSSVDAYNDAADDAARAATAIGIYLVNLDNLTLGVQKDVQVGYQYNDNLAAPPVTDFAFPFDKFLISLRDDVNNRAVTTSIPARNDSAIVVESDGVSIDITAPDMLGYVNSLHTIMLSDDSNAVTALRATISS